MAGQEAASTIDPLYFDSTHVRVSPLQQAVVANAQATNTSGPMGSRVGGGAGRGGGSGAVGAAAPTAPPPDPAKVAIAKQAAAAGDKDALNWLIAAGVVGAGGLGLYAALRNRTSGLSINTNENSGYGALAADHNPPAVISQQGTTQGEPYFGPFEPDSAPVPVGQQAITQDTAPKQLAYQPRGTTDNPHIASAPRPSAGGNHAVQDAIYARGVAGRSDANRMGTATVRAQMQSTIDADPTGANALREAIAASRQKAAHDAFNIHSPLSALEAERAVARVIR